GAPKFPQAGLLELLWRAGIRTSEPRYRDIVLLSLREISAGGIYDHIGGGFARYSTDARWLVPHFEKMLYDNAQLVELLTYAWLATGEPVFKARVEETIAWLTREMLGSEGAFFASLDADSEGHEGKFTVWTRAEVLDVLGPEEGAFFADAYDIAEGGNWEGVSIPNRTGKPPLSDAEAARAEAAKAKLLARRAGRIRPATDDKVLADWNGLMIAALAFPGASFARPEWIALAERAFAFVSGVMGEGGRLAHSWRDGKAVRPGLASDYAAMAKAALALHAATLDDTWVGRAEALAGAVRRHHWDMSAPGYFLSADDAPALIVRPRAVADEATPSATSLMAQNLIRLWRLTGNDAYRADVDAILTASGAAIAGNLFATAGLLNALDLRLGAVDVAIVRPSGADATALLDAVRWRWSPSVVLSVHDDAVALPATHPAAGKVAAGGKATAYVCRGEVCSLPVTTAGELATLLDGVAD
ncbi:MAG TPA: thioredoxin domain-containing protein, partial [Bauldia sp.]|nr:thioredoxin domain-containing protein [Bauldia sp.]